MRYLYILIKFNQWFKNTNGIKAFADQIMNWLMQDILPVAEKIKKFIKQLKEKVKQYTEKLVQIEKQPVIDADEFPAIKSRIRTYKLLLIVFIVGEGFFNYFAAGAIFTFPGIISMIAKFVIASVITAGSVYIFENIFFHLLYEKPYKSDYKEPRNIKKLIILCVAGIVYEILVYYVCKIRGMQIEGANGNGTISTALMLLGMLMPVIAGYFAYERSRYISAYSNTIMIEQLKEAIVNMNNQIKTNMETLENRFKKSCQNRWALLREFKTYKENYNVRNSIPEEDLRGHFCETHQKFVEEAVNRFSEEMVKDDQAIINKLNGNEIEDANYETITNNKLIKIK